MKYTTAAVVVAATLVAGCAGMGPGGTGTTGQQQRTAGQVVDDVAIGTELKARYAADPDLSALKINIDTNQGVVRLRGEVKTFALRRKAEEIARGVRGVRQVNNELIISG